MGISRKDFFRHAMFSLGRTALDISGTVAGRLTTVQQIIPDSTPPYNPRPEMMAEAFNERCLARNSACIACSETCQPAAIIVVPGSGIKVDTARCKGCGTCEYVCPVTPKAVVLIPLN